MILEIKVDRKVTDKDKEYINLDSSIDKIRDAIEEETVDNIILR